MTEDDGPTLHFLSSFFLLSSSFLLAITCIRVCVGLELGPIVIINSCLLLSDLIL